MNESTKVVCLSALVLIIVVSYYDVLAGAGDPVVVVNPNEGKWGTKSTKQLKLKGDMVIGSLDGDQNDILGRPTKIVVDSKGSIYVVDMGYRRILKYDDKGEYLMTIGSRGEGPGEIRFPTAIAVDRQDRLYIAGLGSRINVYAASGDHIKDFQHDFPGAGVKSLAVDSQDNLYVVCFDVLDQNMIHKYDASGTYQSSFCESYAVGRDIDTRVESIYAAGSIFIDGGDFIYYTQAAPYELRRYSPDGNLLMKIFRKNSFLPFPEVQETVSGDGIVVTASVKSTAVIVFDDGTFINVVKKPPYPEPPGEVLIDYFSADGKLLTQVNIERDMDIKCRDGAGRLYAVDMEEYPMVVRYVVSVE